MSTEYNEDTVFDFRHVAEGFRLYHIERNCYLATTFQSFPDYSALESNDSMLHELHSELEVSCVQYASKQASTFYVIEGKPRSRSSESTFLMFAGYHEHPGEQVTWLPKLMSASPLRHHFSKGIAIIATILRLHEFRKIYREWQDIPQELLARQTLHSAGTNLPVLSLLLSGVLPAMSIASLAFYKQRTNQSATFWSSHKGQQILLLSGIWFVHRLHDGSLGELEYIMCSRCVLFAVSAILC